MTQMVTRCPKCATAFRITSTQLESAKGSVRCGSCLYIFKAQEHLVNKKTPATAELKTVAQKLTTASKTTAPATAKASVAPATKTASAAPAKIASSPSPVAKSTLVDKPKVAATKKTTPVKPKPSEDDDDFLISDDMDKASQKNTGYEFDGFIDIDLHPKQNISLFEREIRYEAPKDNLDATDESWAENLLAEDDDDDVPQVKTTKRIAPVIGEAKPAPISEPKPAPAPAQKSKPVVAAEQTSATATGTYDQLDPPLFSLVPEVQHIEEPELHEAFLKATNYEENIHSNKDEPVSFANLFDESDSNSSNEENTSSSKRAVKSSTKIRFADTSRTALLMNIIPAPVEFAAERVRNWYHTKLWASLALLAGIILFFQIAYFKFDYFSRVEPYRSFYAITCPVLGCKVPTLVDTKQIVAYNLVVRNHPKVPSALMVDAIILNKAPFEQPFPDLILAFRTIDDTPVAARRFKPKEYLGGELAGMEHIPQNQPVHITLELADPGPEAVNYSVRIP